MERDPSHLEPSSRSRSKIRTSASSISAEEILLGTVLPTVGIPVLERNTPHVSHERHDGFNKDLTCAIKSDGSEAFGVTTNEKLLSQCSPITIEFRDIAVDVKVEDTSRKRSRFHALAAFFGLASVGPTASKRILHSLSGKIKPCSLVAVMGSSGAGKSTLLNVLSRRILPNEGAVTFNGSLLTESITRQVCAFVQQLDMFLKNLNVHEHLSSQLRLRLPASTTKETYKSREEGLLSSIHLVKCRTTVIGFPGSLGGLSGGERKRLNVASELCTLPPVVFADEPTTGLDSFMAASVVNVLRKMADEGRTVVATIHQPSSRIFELFDQVLLLAEGRIVYFGDRLGCIEWLAHLGFVCPPYTNPADFIIKVVHLPEAPEKRAAKLEQVEQWALRWKLEGPAFLEKWSAQGRDKFLRAAQSLADSQVGAAFQCSPSREGSVDVVERESRYGDLAIDRRISLRDSMMELDATPKVNFENDKYTKRVGWFRQLSILYGRAVASNKRDRQLVHARAMQSIILGMIFGFLFFRLTWNDFDSMARIGGTYALLMNQSMAGAFAVTNTFTPEIPIIRREYESGLLSPSAYIIAKMLADVPVQVIFPSIFAVLVFWLMNLHDSFLRFLVVWVIILLVANGAMSVGYFASALSDNVEFAAIICNLSILPLTIFGGLMVKLDESPVWLSWIQYLSFIRWGFNAASIEIFRGMTIHSPKGNIDGLDFVYNRLTFKEDLVPLCFVMLFVVLIVYRAIGCIAFTWKLRSSKENQ